MQQLQRTVCLRERTVGGHELAEAAAVDVRDAGKVQDDRGPLLQDEAVDLVLEALRVLVDCESSNEIEHGDAADLPLTHLHAHDYILSHWFALVGSATLAPEGEGRKVRRL
jgi:hypothetical protein